MPKRPEEALADMIAGLKEKTGRSLEEWLLLIRGSGRVKHGEIVASLKAEHGLTHGFANQIAQRAIKASSPPREEADPISAQYAGSKAGLKPIYDSIMRSVNAFGPDVDIAPKQGYVSLRRNKQFALLQPSTATRLDVGIQLKGVLAGDRLEVSGS